MIIKGKKAFLDGVGLFALAGLAHMVRLGRKLSPFQINHGEEGQASPRPKRIVFFIPSLGMGGAQRQLVTLLKHLDREQWNPEIITLDTPDKFFLEQVQMLVGSITLLNREGRGATRKVVLIWKLWKHLRRHPCHLLHGWMHYAMALGSIAGTLAGVPCIVGSLRSGSPSRFPWHFPRWQRGIDILTASLHSHLIANSDAVKSDHVRWAFLSERKISVIYNGIEIGEQDSEATNKHFETVISRRHSEYRPIVGIVGRLWPEKDHATFLQVACRIRQDKDRVQFLVVGEGPLQEMLKTESRVLGLSEHITFLPYQKNVLSVMRQMDVLLLTSTHEGFPNVLLEAAAAGTPVVTTAAGGSMEFVVNGETGFVVPGGDVEGLAQKVLQLVDDPELCVRMASHAIARVHQYFSAPQLVKQLEELYERSSHSSKSLRSKKSPLHVCFISANAYTLFWPTRGMTFGGGADVQIYTLMRGLSRIPGYIVSLLTRGGDVLTQCRQGNIQVFQHTLLGTPKEQDQNESKVGLPGLSSESPSGNVWERSVVKSKTWLNSKPHTIQIGIRSCIRGLYSIRRRIVAWPFVIWGIKVFEEAKEIYRWVRVLRDVAADIFVIRCASRTVGIVSVACRLLRKKLVYMIAHDIDVSGEYVTAHKEAGQWYEYGFRHADARICQHSNQAHMVQDRYQGSATLIRSLCPTPVAEQVKPNRRIVLWVARVDSWKQPTLFVKLAKELPSLDFVMVAAPSEVDPYNLAMIQEQGKDLPNLEILGSMSLEESNALFDEAMIFVNTSQAEGFPNTFLQAAARGVPIVSFEVNPDGALDSYQFGYCANGDWTKLIDDMVTLSRNRALREQMGVNGQRYIRDNHDPSVIVDQYTELFQSVHASVGVAGCS